jgi:hypothetical protein
MQLDSCYISFVMISRRQQTTEAPLDPSTRGRGLFFRLSCRPLRQSIVAVYSSHMAPKKPIEKPTEKRKATLDSVLSTVGRGFADLEGKDGARFRRSRRRHHRDQKQDGDQGRLAHLGEQLTSVERELKSIRRDLDDLREKVENVSGFQKEIDHALERIAAIEKHLGLDKKIVARSTPPPRMLPIRSTRLQLPRTF